MSNIISKSYGTLDEAIMKGVNASVRAYNWTTGKTKADLANKLLTVAPIFESAGFIGMGYNNLFNLGTAICMSGFYMFISHHNQRDNKEMEVVEQRALENSCLDFKVESWKNSAVFVGPMWVISGSCNGYFGMTRSDGLSSTNYLIAFGNLVRSASFYVMRADYFPPRKSAIKKGLEKLAEIAESYKAPQIQPVPVPAG